MSAKVITSFFVRPRDQFFLMSAKVITCFWSAQVITFLVSPGDLCLSKSSIMPKYQFFLCVPKRSGIFVSAHEISSIFVCPGNPFFLCVPKCPVLSASDQFFLCLPKRPIFCICPRNQFFPCVQECPVLSASYQFCL